MSLYLAPYSAGAGGSRGLGGGGRWKAAGFLGREEFLGETLYQGSAEEGRGQKETGFSGGPEVSRGQVDCEETDHEFKCSVGRVSSLRKPQVDSF